MYLGLDLLAMIMQRTVWAGWKSCLYLDDLLCCLHLLDVQLSGVAHLFFGVHYSFKRFSTHFELGGYCILMWAGSTEDSFFDCVAILVIFTLVNSILTAWIAYCRGLPFPEFSLVGFFLSGVHFLELHALVSSFSLIAFNFQDASVYYSWFWRNIIKWNMVLITSAVI